MKQLIQLFTPMCIEPMSRVIVAFQCMDCCNGNFNEIIGQSYQLYNTNA